MWLTGLVLFSAQNSRADSLIRDVFGQPLTSDGIHLVDWDGYLANPLLKFYLRPPTNAALPVTAVLSANGPRLYFDTPCAVSSAGPTKSLLVNDAATGAPFRISIFPDRDGLDEDYTLTIIFTDAAFVRQTNHVPIHVRDLDLQRSNDFAVTVNFDRDITGFFDNSQRRNLVRQAAEDWAYFLMAPAWTRSR